MDAMRHTLPRLQLTVPMPMKTGKVGLTFDTTLARPGTRKGTFGRFDIDLSDGKEKTKCWQVLKKYYLIGCTLTFFFH